MQKETKRAIVDLSSFLVIIMIVGLVCSNDPSNIFLKILSGIALLLLVSKMMQEDFREVLNRIGAVLRGAPKAAELNEAETNLLAIHEAGHAVVAWFTPHQPAPKSATIVPTEKALGHVSFHRHANRYLRPSQRESHIASVLGSCAAEALFFGEATSACDEDVATANRMAENVAMKGRADGSASPIAPGYLTASTASCFSGSVAIEVKRIMGQQYEFAAKIAVEHRTEIEMVAKALLERKTLSTKDLEEILGPRPSGD